MITILDEILSNFRNPTRNWSQMGQQELTYDLRLHTLNGYGLNSRLEHARQFGKCRYVKRLGNEYLDLFYPESGLILQYACEELMAITLIVSTASFHVREDNMGVGKITFTDISGRKHSLNERTALNDLVSYLGEPVESGKVGGDMVHTFILKKNFIDTYHHSVTGRLLHVEICEANETWPKG